MCGPVLSGPAQNPYVGLISGTGILCGRRKILVLDGVSSCNDFAMKKLVGQAGSPQRRIGHCERPSGDRLGIDPSSVANRIAAGVKAVSTALHCAAHSDHPAPRKTQQIHGKTALSLFSLDFGTRFAYDSCNSLRGTWSENGSVPQQPSGKAPRRKSRWRGGRHAWGQPGIVMLVWWG